MNTMKREYLKSLLGTFMPNRELLKTVNPEAKRAILYRMTCILIKADRFIG